MNERNCATFGTCCSQKFLVFSVDLLLREKVKEWTRYKYLSLLNNTDFKLRRKLLRCEFRLAAKVRTRHRYSYGCSCGTFAKFKGIMQIGTKAFFPRKRLCCVLDRIALYHQTCLRW